MVPPIISVPEQEFPTIRPLSRSQFATENKGDFCHSLWLLHMLIKELQFYCAAQQIFEFRSKVFICVIFSLNVNNSTEILYQFLSNSKFLRSCFFQVLIFNVLAAGELNTLLQTVYSHEVVPPNIEKLLHKIQRSSPSDHI